MKTLAAIIIMLVLAMPALAQEATPTPTVTSSPTMTPTATYTPTSTPAASATPWGTPTAYTPVSTPQDVQPLIDAIGGVIDFRRDETMMCIGPPTWSDWTVQTWQSWIGPHWGFASSAILLAVVLIFASRIMRLLKKRVSS
jgi:hypothetical protein